MSSTRTVSEVLLSEGKCVYNLVSLVVETSLFGLESGLGCLGSHSTGDAFHVVLIGVVDHAGRDLGSGMSGFELGSTSLLAVTLLGQVHDFIQLLTFQARLDQQVT